MTLEVKKLLQDIADSIELIEQYMQDVTSLSAYINNPLLIDAVERRLGIIGEAMWKANKINSELNVSNKTKIISLRHILVHNYDLVEDEAIWITCKKHLPILKTEVHMLLNSSSQ